MRARRFSRVDGRQRAFKLFKSFLRRASSNAIMENYTLFNVRGIASTSAIQFLLRSIRAIAITLVPIRDPICSPKLRTPRSLIGLDSIHTQSAHLFVLPTLPCCRRHFLSNNVISIKRSRNNVRNTSEIRSKNTKYDLVFYGLS